MTDYDYDNPFFDNHVFSEKDLKRVGLDGDRVIKGCYYLHLLFYPMLHQTTSDGWHVLFKVDRTGRIFIFDMYEDK